MKIRKCKIPNNSLIEKYLPADYSDTFVCEIDTEKEILPDDIMLAFWTDFPNWVNTLFKLRNFLVQFVGLKGSESNNIKEFEQCIRTGTAYSFVSVPAKDSNETVLLLADKHLNAYMSVRIEAENEHKKIFAVTLVHFKNTLGHIYFFFIKPFHGLIVRSMLKRAVGKAIK